MIFISSKTTDEDMRIPSNRKRFLRGLSIDPQSTVEIKQVHDNKIIYVDKPIDPSTEADGLLTNRKDLFLLIKVADCMPIAFYDHKHQAIALIHVGYKGLERGIIKNAVEKLAEIFNAQPRDITVNIGPSIGPCHYKMNIWKEAENQLINCGVSRGRIKNSRICTYETNDYFSHRRSADAGSKDASRFLTILGLN